MHDNAGLAISNATVVNNTIVRNGSTGILVAINAGTNDVVANNVLYDNGWIYGYKQIRDYTGSGALISHDVVFSPDSSRSGVEVGASNTITGNVSQDPLFVTVYSDLHLRSGSP